jgi:hypothetical protein
MGARTTEPHARSVHEPWKGGRQAGPALWAERVPEVDNRALNVDEGRSCVETGQIRENHHMLRSASASDHNILCFGLDARHHPA